MKQLVAAFAFAIACALPSFVQAAAMPFTFSVDQRLKPSQARVVGLDRAPADPVGVLADTQNRKIEYTVDEIVVRPRNLIALRKTLAKYNARIERHIHARRSREAGIGDSDAYLIRVMPSALPLASLANDMQFLGVNGPHRFSSVAAERLVAGVAHLRREGIAAAVNLKMFGTAGGRFQIESGIPEDPDGSGGFINWANLPAWQDPPNGLGIGVIKAWDYLRYKAIPSCWLQDPKKCPRWTQPLIAIVDGGFALDETTGDSPKNNPDWPPGRPFQMNIIDQTSKSAGGKNPNLCSGGASCDWHGTDVFSIAAARPRNQFGAAGTSAEIPRLLFVKTRLFSFDAGYAVYAAAFEQSAVVNASFGISCLADVCGAVYDGIDSFQLAIVDGVSWNPSVIIVVAAGNDANKVESKHDSVPCGLDFVLCVGAMSDSMTAESFSNFGSKVAIWAPDVYPTTPNPDTIGLPFGNSGRLPRTAGTSNAAPFVSGIVALMKALNPSLKLADVKNILQSTALASADPKIKVGYVNAFGAVMAASPNLPPTIKITGPLDGASVIGGAHFVANFSDPEQDPYTDGMQLSWIADGNALCPPIKHAPFDCDALLPAGAHKITATIVDPYGSSASDSISLNVANAPAAAYITYPPDGTTINSNQSVDLRGYGYSPVQQQYPLALTWTTNLQNGQLGTGTQVSTMLPKGDNVITLKASNVQGSGTASITIHVLGAADVPSVQIQSPKDGADSSLNAPVNFSGTATDPVDGPLHGNALRWTDNIDGVLGTGDAFVKVLSGGACAPLVHHITLTATNKAGKSASTMVTVWVGSIC